MKRSKQRINTVGLIANPEKRDWIATLRNAIKLVEAAGREAVSCELPAPDSKTNAGGPDARSVARQSDLIVVFGGDGTMLRVAREIGGLETPILGINTGSFGFLTAAPRGKMAKVFQHVWDGDFQLDSRPILRASGLHAGRNSALTAVNDFVISRGNVSRMIELEVSVDDNKLTTYCCDGLIVSSPTGSTAYSLSAGGPIVSPDSEVFTLTPICPHALSNRSVIVNLKSTVVVKVLSKHLETVITCDGQAQSRLVPGDVVRIQRSRRDVRLVNLSGWSFYDTLRHKLNWSGSNV